MLDPAFLSRLEKLALRSRSRAAGARQGSHRSRRRGQSLEFADHREYVPGDDIRHLDWHLYARLDALFVKLFEAREDRTVQIVLDRSASMAGAKWDAARQAAAAVAWASLCGLDRVQLFVADRGLRAEGRPARGRGAVHRIFQYLQGTGTAGGTDLLQVTKGLPPARAGAITILISDLWDAAGLDAPLARLAHRGGELHVLHVIDRRELDPSHLSGDLTLVDAETGAELSVTVDKATRTQLRAAADDWFAGIDELCRRRRIGLFRIDAADPVEEELITWLRSADDLARRGAASRLGGLRR